MSSNLVYIEADDLVYDVQSLICSLLEATLPPLWSVVKIKENTKPTGQSLPSIIHPFFIEFYQKYSPKKQGKALYTSSGEINNKSLALENLSYGNEKPNQKHEIKTSEESRQVTDVTESRDAHSDLSKILGTPKVGRIPIEKSQNNDGSINLSQNNTDFNFSDQEQSASLFFMNYFRSEMSSNDLYAHFWKYKAIHEVNSDHLPLSLMDFMSEWIGIDKADMTDDLSGQFKYNQASNGIQDTTQRPAYSYENNSEQYTNKLISILHLSENEKETDAFSDTKTKLKIDPLDLNSNLPQNEMNNLSEPQPQSNQPPSHSLPILLKPDLISSYSFNENADHPYSASNLENQLSNLEKTVHENKIFDPTSMSEDGLAMKHAFDKYYSFFHSLLMSLSHTLIKPKVTAFSALHTLYREGYTICLHSDIFNSDRLKSILLNWGYSKPSFIYNFDDVFPHTYDRLLIFSRYYNPSKISDFQQIGYTSISYTPSKTPTNNFISDFEDVDWSSIDIHTVSDIVYPLKITYGDIQSSPELFAWKKVLCLHSPLLINGKVISGFGRGSSLLGIPTANVETSNENLHHILPGVYFGWCYLGENKSINSSFDDIYKMVMSIGFNPYFENLEMSVEPHIFHNFSESFHGAEIHLCVVAMIRCEADFPNFGHLIKAIQLDCDTARLMLLSNDNSQEYINSTADNQNH